MSGKEETFIPYIVRNKELNHRTRFFYCDESCQRHRDMLSVVHHLLNHFLVSSRLDQLETEPMTENLFPCPKDRDSSIFNKSV